MNSTGSDTQGAKPRRRSFITLRRINFFLILILLVTALGGCGGCGGGCKSCKPEDIDKAIEISCQLTGMVAPGCSQICQAKIQFYDEATGSNLTNVHNSSYLDFDMIDDGNVQHFYDQPIGSDGSLIANLDPCMSCDNRILDPKFQIFGASLKSQADCPAGQCRQWTVTTNVNFSFSHMEGCTVVFRVPVTMGSRPCRNC